MKIEWYIADFIIILLLFRVILMQNNITFGCPQKIFHFVMFD